VNFYCHKKHQFVAAGCNYHDEKESYISQTVLRRLEVFNEEPRIQLAWMPINNDRKTFETIFQVVSKDKYDCDIMFGTDWNQEESRPLKKRKSDESEQHICPMLGTESIKIDKI
jgi:hypothetical protein